MRAQQPAITTGGDSETDCRTSDICHWLAMTDFLARSTVQVQRVDRDSRPYEVRGKEYDRAGGRKDRPYGGQGEFLLFGGNNSKSRTFVLNFLFTYFIIVVQ